MKNRNAKKRYRSPGKWKGLTVTTNWTPDASALTAALVKLLTPSVNPYLADAVRNSVNRRLAANGEQPRVLAKHPQDSEITYNRLYVRDTHGRFAHIAGTKGHLATGMKPNHNLPGPADLTFMQTLGGSTGAVLSKAADGSKWVVKSHNQPHLESEVQADHLYAAMGVKVPQSGMHGGTKVSRHLEGKTLGEWEKTASILDITHMHKEISKHFAADALLGNWDVVGQAKDNILVTKDGQPIRIDNGGALHYRAMGKLKPAGDFGDIVHELATMRDPAKNPVASAIYQHLTDADVHAQMKDLLTNRQAILAAATDPKLKETLGKRLDYMESLVKKTIPHVPTPAVPSTMPSAGPITNHDLNTPDGLVAHVSKGAPPKMTALYMQKLAFLNPQGISSGIVHSPATVTAAENQAFKDHLSKVLPPGTKVKIVTGLSAKHLTGTEPYTKINTTIPSGSPTPVPAPKPKAATPPTPTPTGPHSGFKHQETESLWNVIDKNSKPGEKFTTKEAEKELGTLQEAMVAITELHAAGHIKMVKKGEFEVVKPTTYGNKHQPVGPSQSVPHAPAPIPSGPGPLPTTYAGLQPGHKYVNSQGKLKEVESVKHGQGNLGNETHITFKGEYGTAMVQSAKAFPGKEPTPLQVNPVPPSAPPAKPKKVPSVSATAQGTPTPPVPHPDAPALLAKWASTHPPAPLANTDPDIAPPISSHGVVKLGSYKALDTLWDKQEHEQWAKSLSSAETSAISGWKGSAHHIRKEVAQGTLDNVSRDFMDGVSKSKPFSGIVYRGIKEGGSIHATQVFEDCKKALAAGGTWSDPSPHCTSPNASVAVHFSAGDLVFRIRTQTGRPIQKVGGYSTTGEKYNNEMEVVGMPGTKYKVVGVHENVEVKHHDNPSGTKVKYVIELEELV